MSRERCARLMLIIHLKCFWNDLINRESSGRAGDTLKTIIKPFHLIPSITYVSLAQCELFGEKSIKPLIEKLTEGIFRWKDQALVINSVLRSTAESCAFPRRDCLFRSIRFQPDRKKWSENHLQERRAERSCWPLLNM